MLLPSSERPRATGDLNGLAGSISGIEFEKNETKEQGILVFGVKTSQSDVIDLLEHSGTSASETGACQRVTCSCPRSDQIQLSGHRAWLLNKT